MKILRVFSLMSLFTITIFFTLVAFPRIGNVVVNADQPRRAMQLGITPTTTISITNSGFEPVEILINLGDTVAWVNQTGQPQRVVGEMIKHKVYLPIIMRQLTGATNNVVN